MVPPVLLFWFLILVFKLMNFNSIWISIRVIRFITFKSSTQRDLLKWNSKATFTFPGFSFYTWSLNIKHILDSSEHCGNYYTRIINLLDRGAVIKVNVHPGLLGNVWGWVATLAVTRLSVHPSLLGRSWTWAGVEWLDQFNGDAVLLRIRAWAAALLVLNGHPSQLGGTREWPVVLVSVLGLLSVCCSGAAHQLFTRIPINYNNTMSYSYTRTYSIIITCEKILPKNKF